MFIFIDCPEEVNELESKNTLSPELGGQPLGTPPEARLSMRTITPVTSSSYPIESSVAKKSKINSGIITIVIELLAVSVAELELVKMMSLISRYAAIAETSEFIVAVFPSEVDLNVVIAQPPGTPISSVFETFGCSTIHI